MKKAYIIKHFNASWGVQNRVEALSDWAANGDTPYEIDVTGSNALIILNDNKKASYESEYKWDRDVATLEGLIKDIKDPIFAEDGQTFEEIDMESANQAQVKAFENFAMESCSPFGFDLLRPLGFTGLPEVEKDELPSDADLGARSVQELEEMAKNIDLSAGLESLTPDEPIEEYSSENDPLLQQAEAAPVVTPTPEHTAEAQPVEDTTVEPEVAAVAIAEASDNGVTPSVGKIVDPKEVFIEEFMKACEDYDVTPKELVAIIMSIKAIANKAAEVDMISTESISADEFKTLRSRQYPKSFVKQKVTTTKQAKKFYKELDKLGVKNTIDLGDENSKFVESKKAIYVGDMYGSSAFLLPDGTVGFIDNEEDQGKFYKTSTVEKDIHEANISTDDVTGKEDYSYQNAVPYVQDPHGVKDEDLEIPRQGMNVSGSMNNVEFAEVQNMMNGNESLLNIFSSKRKNTVTKQKLDALVDMIDSRIKLVLPKYQAVLDAIKEDAMILDGYKNGFKINYRVERMDNKVRFSIIDMDHAMLVKANIGTFLLNMFAYALASLGNAPIVHQAPNSMNLRFEFEWVDLEVLTKPITKELNTYCTGYRYGKLDKETLGIEIEYKLADSIGTEAMDAEDVYSSLVNDGPSEFGELTTPEEEEYVETSMEALFSKKKNKSDNEVLKDINKVLNDIKDIAKKAWNELQERNKELIAKYGAFIKLLLDIKDVVFMDNRSIALQIASFNTKKANNEIVPDNTEEALLKQVSKGAVGAVFGPFANMAKGEDKPGQLMIAVANELRNAIIKQTKSFEIKPAINLVEDELSGVFTLTAEFKNVPQTANESVEPEQTADERPLIERLAMESATDDEFFAKVLEHKAEIEYPMAMDCVNNNMWAYFKTGEKLLNDRAVSSKRILQYIKK